MTTAHTLEVTNPDAGVAHERQAQTGLWMALGALAVLCAALYFFRLGSFGLLDSYYPAAAREMVEAGDMLIPRLNYQMYFSKPIITFWLISSAFYTMGCTALASRIWSAILSSALVFVCFFATRAVLNTRAGLIAALLLVSSPLLITSCRVSIIDSFFSVFLGIAVCASIVTLFSQHRKWWPAIYAFLGLAVLTKGPAGLVLYCGGALLFVLAARPSIAELREWWQRLRLLPGIALFTAIVMPWFIAVGLATKWLWLKVFFIYENLGRFGGHTNIRHHYWWWYALPLGYGFFPWSFCLPSALYSAFRRGRTNLGSADNSDSANKASTNASPANRANQTSVSASPSSRALLFAASSAVAIIAFFSASKTQYDIYILPAWCSLAVMVGITVERWIADAEALRTAGRAMRYASNLFVGLGVLMLPAGIIAAAVVPHLHGWMRGCIALSAVVLSAAWITQRFLLAKNRFSAVVLTVLIGTGIGYSAGVPVLTERFYEEKYKDVHELAATLANEKGQVVQFHEFNLGLLFYRKGPIDYFYDASQVLPRSKCSADQLKDAPSPLHVIVFQGLEKPLLERKDVSFTLVRQVGDWRLYRSENAMVKRPPTLEGVLKDQSIDELLHINSTFTMPYGGGSYQDFYARRQFPATPL